MLQENLRKKLIYRSSYRGSRENDQLLGDFVKKYIGNYTQKELELFEKFLEENENDIFSWISGQSDLPVIYQSKLLRDLFQFARSKNVAK